MASDRIRALLGRAGPLLGLGLLSANFVVGADVLGARESLFGSATPAARAAAVSRSGAFQAIDSSLAGSETVLRSVPWWQGVGVYAGAGSQTVPTRISDTAIQWRVAWSCRTGRFVVRTAASAKPLIDSTCGRDTTSELTAKVAAGLRIEAAGPWRARVDQQVDVPLIEPPLPAMSAPGARAVAGGTFYRIDQTGRGRVTFYRLPTGRYALRLAGFYVTPNVDLELRLSRLRTPRTTAEYLSAPAKLIAPLNITAGSINFILPAGEDPTQYRTLVLWCARLSSAYAAAGLGPVAR